MACNSCIIGMLGKDCVGFGMDDNCGVPKSSKNSESDVKMLPECQKLYRYGERLFVGFSGLEEDILKLHKELMNRTKVHECTTNSRIAPQALTSLLSNFLFEHRFGALNVDTLVVGIDQKTKKPFICVIDPFGHQALRKDHAVQGNDTDVVYFKCCKEWRPDLNADEVFNAIGKVMVTSLDPDELKIWSAKIYILDFNRLVERSLQGR